MLILKVILFVSFVGLAVIIVKNKVANPAMRIQFFEDLERNKKRIKHIFSYLGTLGVSLQRFLGILWSSLVQGGKNLLPYATIILRGALKGVRLFLKDLKRVLLVGKNKLVRQVAELREDMKTFEVPIHKKDFLERLHEEKQGKEEKKEEKPPLVIKKDPLGRREERKDESQGEDIVIEREVGSFSVHKLEAKPLVREVEVDKRILHRKEQGLLDAIVKNPKNPNFYKKLGKVYLLMNNTDDAKNCFEYALKLGAQDPEIKSLLVEIKKEAVRS